MQDQISLVLQHIVMLLLNAVSFFHRYRQSRFNARRIRKRVVFKHGDCNVEVANVAKRRRKYLQDIFTTLVDAQWRWTLLVFAMNFLLSWLGFAIVWWLIVFSHGDLLPEHQLVSLFSVFYYLQDQECVENRHSIARFVRLLPFIC